MTGEAPVSWALIRNTGRYYARQKRWKALARSLTFAIFWRHGTELCQECGGRNGFVWWAPQPLWNEVMPSEHGLLCPGCFDRKTAAAGIRVRWTPMVTARNGAATTNHWFDETRDWLMAGQPDPGFFRDDLVRYPQPTWAAARAGLTSYNMPPIDYYPAENCGPVVPQ